MPDTTTKQAIYKQAKVTIDDSEPRTVISTISTGAVDRDKEVLLPKGAEMESYRANPVVLWGHDNQSPPIGKNVWIKTTSKGMIAKTEFADTPRGNEVFELFKGGFLKAFSVGFNPTEHRQPTTKDLTKHPEWAEVRRIYSKWEMLEYSVVPIPANPDALVTAVGKGLNVSDELWDELDMSELPVVKSVVMELADPVVIDVLPEPVIELAKAYDMAIADPKPTAKLYSAAELTEMAEAVINKKKGIV